VDVVGNVRDGEHLQYLVFLAQEFGLLAEPVFLFGSMGPDPRRPHSLLLEDHFFMLLRDGIIDLDGAGRLRARRDLFALPSSGLTGRRLAALSDLSPARRLCLPRRCYAWLARAGTPAARAMTMHSLLPLPSWLTPVT